MKLRYFVIFLTFSLAAPWFLLLIFMKMPEPKTDMVEINRISHRLKQTWPSPSPDDSSDFTYPFSLIDTNGTLLFSSSLQASKNMPEAILENDIILDFYGKDGTEGKLLIRTGILRKLSAATKQLYGILACFTLFWLILAISIRVYLNRKLLLPFKRLQAFAGHIAMGNLDVPLPMDQDHLFGVFTESFDLMRDKLAQAKKAEAMANQSKKELIASLSHDIKTPVTAIRLVSELLQVTAPDELREKIDTIYNKAGQIDLLVTDLFQSAMEELQQLNVNLTEIESSVLKQFFQNADYYDLISCPPVPGCLLKTDPLRLEQIIDNVVNNSYKYANTPIEIVFTPDSDFLKVTVLDHGPGVEMDELPHLPEKFYRGKRALESDQAGSGLGLYVSGILMEKMNGEILCENKTDGFSVSLLIPLA